MRAYLPLLCVTLLTACAATPPFETAGADRGLTPAAVLRDPAAVRGRAVIWGGVIVASANLARETRVELLLYPVDEGLRPDREGTPRHRALIYYPGYLETADYRPGRLLTVRGRLQGLKPGRVGETEYEFPVVEAERVYLWPEREAAAEGPRVHFGIGVLFGR